MNGKNIILIFCPSFKDKINIIWKGGRSYEFVCVAKINLNLTGKVLDNKRLKGRGVGVEVREGGLMSHRRKGRNFTTRKYTYARTVVKKEIRKSDKLDSIIQH